MTYPYVVNTSILLLTPQPSPPPPTNKQTNKETKKPQMTTTKLGQEGNCLYYYEHTLIYQES